jgi:probable phosphoglycerate mutase
LTEDLRAVPFWYLRHGETDWNKQRLTQGGVEVPLNDRGIAQAEASGALLAGKGIVSMVASPQGRAQETARIVARALGLSFTTDPELHEARFGAQEGKVMGAWYDDWVDGTYTPEGGESFAALRIRIIPAVNRALALPGPVLIVAHGGMFRAVRAAMGLSGKVRTENGAALFCEPGSPWRVTQAMPAPE